MCETIADRPQPRSTNLRWEGLGADSEEKREPARDIDTVAVDSLRAVDPQRRLEKSGIGARIRLIAEPRNGEIMRIHVGCELTFEFPQTTPMIVMLNVHFSRVSDLERPDHL